MPEPWQILLTLLAGFVTGILSGMFGIGGAVVSNPAVRSLGASPIESVGSTLPSILPSAISGALRYRREGLLRGRVILWTGLTGAVGSVGGSLMSALVPDARLLTITIAVLMMYTAVRTARAARVSTAPADEIETVGAEPLGAQRREQPLLLIAIGAAAGLSSGLLGIGGGLLMVPAFLTLVRLSLREALGTSLACVGIIAVPGIVTHAILGHIVWAFAIPLSIGVIPGARIGATLAIRASDRALRMTVAIGLSSIAVVYATTELLSILAD